MDAAQVYAKLNTRPEGLTGVEAQARLQQYGPNVLAKDQRAGIGKLLWRAILNPLVLLLAAPATISFATGATSTATRARSSWTTRCSTGVCAASVISGTLCAIAYRTSTRLMLNLHYMWPTVALR